MYCSKCHLVLFSMPQRLINYLKHPNLRHKQFTTIPKQINYPLNVRAHKHITIHFNSEQSSKRGVFRKKIRFFHPTPPFGIVTSTKNINIQQLPPVFSLLF